MWIYSSRRLCLSAFLEQYGRAADGATTALTEPGHHLYHLYRL